MEICLFAGNANLPLAQAVAERLGVGLGDALVRRFADGELHVQIRESVRGRDVVLLQPTSPPVDEHIVELLFLADACRRAGASRLTAVMPYFGYARHDRRASGREPVGARLVADLLTTAGLSRVVAVDLHNAALEGFFSIPLEHLSAVPLLSDAARHFISERSVIVAPDLGAAKLADRHARLLRLPVAVVHKTRLSGEDVSVHAITGEVRGRSPLLVDDMISTGGTIEAAVNALLAAGCAPDIAVIATHGLFVGPAMARLSALPVRRFLVTDSVAAATGAAIPIELVRLDGLLAEAIRLLHDGRSLEALLARGEAESPPR
ncbi:ribose-phosphate diphosphokinase [Sorangium sp. So ce1000]|uniref:ribose-phosphate diphosphokinase n=1 Tax=Sorangium sp. So ce1000 TaxID=3133325 RepID=UPI003F5ECCBD